MTLGDDIAVVRVVHRNNKGVGHGLSRTMPSSPGWPVKSAVVALHVGDVTAAWLIEENSASYSACSGLSVIVTTCRVFTGLAGLLHREVRGGSQPVPRIGWPEWNGH